MWSIKKVSILIIHMLQIGSYNIKFIIRASLWFDILPFLNMVPKLVVAMIESPITLNFWSRCLSMRSSTVVFISLLIRPREVNKRIVSTTLHFKSKKFYRLYRLFKRSLSLHIPHNEENVWTIKKKKNQGRGDYFQELVVFSPLK